MMFPHTSFINIDTFISVTDIELNRQFIDICQYNLIKHLSLNDIPSSKQFKSRNAVTPFAKKNETQTHMQDLHQRELNNKPIDSPPKMVSWPTNGLPGQSFAFTCQSGL